MNAEERAEIRAEHYPHKHPMSGACVCGTRYPCATIALLDALDAAERDRAALIEAMFHIYVRNGADTDGDRTGAEFLSHCGIGGSNLEAFIKSVHAAMDETWVEIQEESARADAAEAKLAAVKAVIADAYLGYMDPTAITALRNALAGGERVEP